MPTGLLLTTGDHLVRPRKQRALAEAIHAEVVEVAGDHLSPWTIPNDFARATRRLVDSVARRAAPAAVAAQAPSDASRAAG